jgi:hypothetical protein
MSTHHQSSSIRFRMSPVAIALTAGAIGLICGALFVAVLAMSFTQSSDVAQNQSVETTGAAVPARAEQQPMQTPDVATATAEAATPASADDESKQAAAECDRQAWPYITQQCLAERSNSQRRVRVITTDNIAAPVVNAIETSREPSGAKGEGQAKQPLATPPASAPVAAVPAAPAQAEAKATPVVDTGAPPAPAQTVPLGERAVVPVAPVVPAAVPASQSKPQHASGKEERGKKARDKRKREAKSRRAPLTGDDDETEDSGSRPTRGLEREDSSSHRRGRIVERWTEREYDVPSYNGSQRRRVIVIRRNGDRADAYMPSAGVQPRSLFGY